MDPLFATLLDLLRELDACGMPLTVGGGFGLYLKHRHLARTDEQTLFVELPGIRSTNDIDLFLRVEVLADLTRTTQVANAIRKLGYTPVEEAKYLQWKKPIIVSGVEQEVKLDVLVGPLGSYRSKLKVSRPRARPKGDIQFHAYTVDEALHIEDQPVRIPVDGVTSDGQSYRSIVYVPEAFPYLLMKLTAFSDRKQDANKDLGRHHSLDAYTIVGMMTESEYTRARALGATDRDNVHVSRARDIVAADFSSETAEGLLRMREHVLYRSDFRLKLWVTLSLHRVTIANPVAAPFPAILDTGHNHTFSIHGGDLSPKPGRGVATAHTQNLTKWKGFSPRPGFGERSRRFAAGEGAYDSFSHTFSIQK